MLQIINAEQPNPKLTLSWLTENYFPQLIKYHTTDFEADTLSLKQNFWLGCLKFGYKQMWSRWVLSSWKNNLVSPLWWTHYSI